MSGETSPYSDSVSTHDMASSELRRVGLEGGDDSTGASKESELVATPTHQPQDQEQQQQQEPKSKKPYGFYLTFVALNIISILFAIDSTIFAVAVPSIAQELHGTTLQSFWANIAFLLAVVITQPLYTGLSDVYGRKPLLYVAFLFSLVGCLVFALASNMTAIIAGRFLQGVGGGLDVLSEIIVADITTLKDRPFYLGIMAIPMATGSIVGPSLGAIFCQHATWRWIGWVNLPLLGISCPLIIFFLKLQKIEASLLQRTRQLDWIGMGLFSVGCLVFVLPLSWAGTLYPWRSWQTLLPLIIGVLVLVVFAVYESRPAEPIVPHRLFRSRTLTAALAAGYLYGFIFYPTIQYLPFFLQAIPRKTLLQSALYLLPTTAVGVLAAGVSVVGVGLVGSYRWLIWMSWILNTVGTGLLVLLDASSTQAFCVGLPVVWGVGMGALARLLHVPLQASVSIVDDSGRAIGLFLLVRLLGGLVGLALTATIFSSTFEPSIMAIGDALPESVAFLRNPNAAIAFIPQLRTLDLPDGVVSLIVHAYLTSFRFIFYTLTGFGVFGVIVSSFIQDLTLKREELGRQQYQA